MKKLIAFAAATMVLLWSSVAFACQCQETRDRDESYRTATYVVFAEAVQSDDGLALKVRESYKGSRSKRTHPVGEAEDCNFEFEVGKTYMVYGSKGEKKREIVVDTCGSSAQVDHEPLTFTIWSLADELTFKTNRKDADRHGRARNQITDRAVGKIKWAMKQCDPDVWKAKEKMKARVEVRFDVQPEGDYKHTLLKYETPSPPGADVKKCLEEKLAEDPFKPFPGGPVSVSGYWIIDRLDASFGEDRSSATVLRFKSQKRLLE